MLCGLFVIWKTHGLKLTGAILRLLNIQTQKERNVLLRSIRDMEDAWFKVNGRNFALVEYTDTKGEKRPMYKLNK
nr:MAG TPA: regulatory protein [Caudoviricetes sp.]